MDDPRPLLPLLLSVQDVQRLLGIHRDAAYLVMHESGRAIRLGRRVMIRPADLDGYLARLAEGGQR